MSVSLDEIPGAIGPRGLTRTLRLVGIGKLTLAGMTLLLAFTGYETPRPVNFPLLFLGVNLLVLGWSCLAAGRMFGVAARSESLPPLMAEALGKTNRIFGYYLFLLALANLGVGFDLVLFLAKILGRSS